MILYVISVGLSVTMGLMGFINLAHGVFAMAGGFILSTLMARAGVPFPLAVLIAFVSVSAMSIVFERLLYSRLYAAGELSQVLFSIGLIFVSMAIARLIYGDRAVPVFLPDYLRGQVHVLGRDFPTYRVFLIVVSTFLIFLLWFGVERTRWGAMVRAAVDHRAMAQSIGINTKVLFMSTFALGSIRIPALTRVAGAITLVSNLNLSGVYLPALASAGSLTITDAPPLVEIMLPALAQLDGDLILARLPSLELVDLSVLPSVAGTFSVDATPRITTWLGATDVTRGPEEDR